MASEPNPERYTLYLLINHDAAERFGGSIRYLLLGLIDESFNIVLVAPEDLAIDRISSGPAAVIKYRRPSRFFPKWEMRRLMNEIARQSSAARFSGPAVVHALAPGSAGLARSIAAGLKCPWILTISRAMEPEHETAHAGLARFSAAIYPSARLRDAPHHAVPRGCHTDVIHLGMMAGTAPAAFRSPDRAPSVIYAGPLAEGAGCESLLQAGRHVMQRFPKLMIVLLGKGPAEASLRRFARTLNMADSVTLTGRLENWRVALDGADLFCLPRAGPIREEPLYALGAGMGVIAADGAPYDAVIHEQTALTFPESDVPALADRFVRFLSDRTFTRAIAATAQACVRTNHSVAEMVERHVACYRRVLSSAAAPAGA